MTDWEFLITWRKNCAKKSIYYPGQKKKNHPRDSRLKNAVPRVKSCSIRRDRRRAKVTDSRGSDLPCADCAWSSMMSHVEQRSSRCESRWWFYFFVQGSTMKSTTQALFQVKSPAALSDKQFSLIDDCDHYSPEWALHMHCSVDKPFQENGFLFWLVYHCLPKGSTSKRTTATPLPAAFTAVHM